jgi:hypothetical protein
MAICQKVMINMDPKKVAGCVVKSENMAVKMVDNASRPHLGSRHLAEALSTGSDWSNWNDMGNEELNPTLDMPFCEVEP